MNLEGSPGRWLQGQLRVAAGTGRKHDPPSKDKGERNRCQGKESAAERTPRSLNRERHQAEV